MVYQVNVDIHEVIINDEVLMTTSCSGAYRPANILCELNPIPLWSFILIALKGLKVILLSR